MVPIDPFQCSGTITHLLILLYLISFQTFKHSPLPDQSHGLIKITLWILKNHSSPLFGEQGGHWIRLWALTSRPLPIQRTLLLLFVRDLCHGWVPWAQSAPWDSLLIKPQTWPHWLANLGLTPLPECSVVNTLKKWQAELVLPRMKLFLWPLITPTFSCTLQVSFCPFLAFKNLIYRT